MFIDSVLRVGDEMLVCP